MESVVRGEMKVEFLKKEDLARPADGMVKYADASLGLWMPRSWQWLNDCRTKNYWHCRQFDLRP